MPEFDRKQIVTCDKHETAEHVTLLETKLWFILQWQKYSFDYFYGFYNIPQNPISQRSLVRQKKGALLERLNIEAFGRTPFSRILFGWKNE